jgi:TctA family transporter
MVPRFGLLVMIAAVTSLGLFAAHTSLFELMEVTLFGFLAGGMRVRARLRPDNRL